MPEATTGLLFTLIGCPLPLARLAIEDQIDLLDLAQGMLTGQRGMRGYFGRLKTELFYPGNWQAMTIEQFIEAVDSYIGWYNEKRIKISLGSLSPIEYGESLGFTAVHVFIHIPLGSDIGAIQYR